MEICEECLGRGYVEYYYNGLYYKEPCGCDSDQMTEADYTGEDCWKDRE